MTEPEHDLAQIAQRQLDAMRDEELARHADGKSFGHLDGYTPLLVQFTREDGAARGLRRMTDPSCLPPAEHLSAVEAIQQGEATLIVAPSGWGKTTFARHVALNLSGARHGDADFNEARLGDPVPRHDSGAPEGQVWEQPARWPVFVDIVEPTSFRSAIETNWPGYAEWRGSSNRPPVLVIADHIERLGHRASAFLADAQAAASDDLRIVMLADSAAAEPWRLPDGMVRHRLMPLNRAQRSDAAAAGSDLEPAGFHKVSLAFGPDIAGADDLADRWMAKNAPDNAGAVAEAALASVLSGAGPVEAPIRVPQHLGELIAAGRLAESDIAEVAQAFARSPTRMAPVVASVFRRWDRDRHDRLAEALATLPDDIGRRGALLAATYATDLATGTRRTLIASLLSVVTGGLLSPAERIRAGARLSAMGDPRDLAELVAVDGGTFRMGSEAHPNSCPAFDTEVGAFRIGRYPVTNSLFADFAADTGRIWRTQHGRHPDRANGPAVELNWHDAGSFCDWATERWRKEGRIDATEVCRLPTEPEWERAARGNLEGPGPVYPWGLDWRHDCANAEPVGHNDTCAVGLFPGGISPYGCLDMAGQVWEWTSTLWGEAMEAPSFRYPYRIDDGREKKTAAPGVRRILRGGCFTGGPAKANSTYRGSLEPAGFWRGNGFRIAVVKESA